MEKMTIEQLGQLSTSEAIAYESSLPREEREQVHKELMAFYKYRNFMEDADFVVDMCNRVKTKYGADSKCAAEIVKLTLLKQIADACGGD